MARGTAPCRLNHAIVSRRPLSSVCAGFQSVERRSSELSQTSRSTSLAAGRSISDVQTGFRLYTRELIERTGFPEPRFEAESAVVVRAVRLGLRIATTPIRLGKADGRGTSHFRPLVDSLRIARGVIGARFGTRT